MLLHSISAMSGIREAKTKKGEVSVRGWVHRERGSNKLKFIVLRDSTGIIQCVFEKAKMEQRFPEIAKLQVESALEVKGTIKEDSRAPGGYEISASDFRIIGDSDSFPITKDQSPEFLMDKRHLWLRSRRMQSILKIRSTVFGAIHEYFRKEGFYEFQSPIFQATQAEGGSDLFTVDYFGSETYLAQTWQLYAEAGIFALERIYTIAPSFRAEKSRTNRHLTEYWHAEAEACWMDLDAILDLGEGLVKHIVKKVVDDNPEELEFLERDVQKLKTTIDKPFIRMTYDEALRILKDRCSMEVEWGKDLRTIEEEKLTELYEVPLIVTRYPKKVKAFYMQEDPENPDVVLGVDFLAPEGYGEIIGGSQREADIESIRRRLKETGEDPGDYEYYLDTRRYGSVPHSGFGMGVERVITWIAGLDTIKDSIPFPRTMTRKTP